MHVLRHDYKGMDLKSNFAAISIDCLQEDSDVILDHKQSSALPRGESNEVGSGRGDESSRFQGRTSAAKAAIFAQPKPSRVELVPFRVDFVVSVFVLGKLV